MKRPLHLMFVSAVLGLAAGSVLQGLRLAALAGLIAAGAGADTNATDLTAIGAITVAVRLALFPLFVAFVVLWARSRPRTSTGRYDFNRVLADAPLWSRVLVRGMAFWALVDFARICLSVFNLMSRPDDPWSIWLFLYAVTLAGFTAMLREPASDGGGGRQ
ncbi:hypothetical protein [Rhodoplanes roseus]|uniref:Paraquat-inducible protein A n=1 Tax=Rhodoplanes roseus TaxID=29409 RepID=A0A327L120_9BRAD|nr:hypothetical protein [Rhodoplanes roseus]RAI43954.1 hypothetical protein CH341_11575 [Rhodoplanes roseus]